MKPLASDIKIFNIDNTQGYIYQHIYKQINQMQVRCLPALNAYGNTAYGRLHSCKYLHIVTNVLYFTRNTMCDTALYGPEHK